MKDSWSIRLSGVTRAYKGRTVLDIPDFTFSSGRNYAFVGANGSGKSTLLRLISGAVRPSCGEIAFEGIAAEDVAYLPQKPYAFSLSVLKNIMLTGVDAEKASELLSEVGLSSLSAARGDSLSGGEAQRLSVARLLAKPHKLLLLDEPTSATDVAGNELVEKALRRYMTDTGCSVIFATHALSQAGRLADELLFFSGGAIAEHGSASELLSQPKTPELRAFTEFWNNK